MKRNFFRLIAASLVLIGTSFAQVVARDFPSRPVRIIVPYGAGGSGDTLARLLGAKLAELWGQLPIIDNRAGANGFVGTEFAARAKPDGYTLYLGTDGPMTISASLYKSVPYDWKHSFVPISMVAFLHQALVVNADFPARTIGEFVARARQYPGKFNYASIGVGSSPHLGAELFKSVANIDIVHVPYRGTSQAMVGLLGGDVSMFIVGTSSASPFIQKGTLRGLAVTAPRRVASLPDVPTFAEVGMPDVDVSIWFALFAPAETPPAIVKQLNADLAQVLHDAKFKDELAARGFDGQYSSSEQLDAFLDKDYAKWRDLINKVNIRIE